MYYHWLSWQVAASIGSKVLIVGSAGGPSLRSMLNSVYPVSTAVEYSDAPTPDFWRAGKRKKEHNWNKKPYFGRTRIYKYF